MTDYLLEELHTMGSGSSAEKKIDNAQKKITLAKAFGGTRSMQKVGSLVINYEANYRYRYACNGYNQMVSNP